MKRKRKTKWIAEEKVIFVHADGRKVPGRIAVGLPVQTEPDEASCWIAIDGFFLTHKPLVGMSTLQVLLLAVRFIGWSLHDFLSRGGHVLDPDGNTFTMSPLFGPLLEKANGDPSIMDEFETDDDDDA